MNHVSAITITIATITATAIIIAMIIIPVKMMRNRIPQRTASLGPGEGHDGGNKEGTCFQDCQMGETGRKNQKMPCACVNLCSAGILSQHRKENLLRVAVYLMPVDWA